MNVTHHQSHRALNPFRRSRNGIVAGLRMVHNAFKTKNPEVSPARGEVGIGYFIDGSKRHLRLIIRFSAHKDWIPFGHNPMQPTPKTASVK